MPKLILTVVCLMFAVISLVGQTPKGRPSEEAHGWVFVGANRDGSHRVYYNKDRLTKKSESVMETWAKFYSPSRKPKNPYYVFYQMDLNCTTHQSRAFYYIEYRKNGSPIRTVSQPDAEWSPVVPGSSGDMLLQAVCKK